MRFKDKEEALRRLEAELLREEEEEARASEEWEESDDWDEEEEEEAWDEESDEEDEDWDGETDEEEEPDEDWDEEEEEVPADSLPYRIYNSDRVDEDLEEFGEQVYSARRKARGRWVAAGALIALAAVLLVLAWLGARYGGV